MKWLLVAAAAVVPGALSAQIAQRVDAMEDGVVRFSYATRDGVEICDHGIRVGERQLWWRRDGRNGREANCRVGYRPSYV